ncbi:Arc family DNA-binding protein [Paracoccus homiensis]|uniref:Arc-like DNA binding domain-containing protein n=1 Tax=Paracoccus homiensis TaxID=364199 RepID=A0A1I0GWU3_9RHOB|nr:Arc family DNA-binding protein [Paracoccus homiensis]SET74927.1 Arc-like DNA binding domain-containing protein [Paracoccus homiensis]
MSTIPTNRESDRFMLRLPDGMRDRIKAAAEANNRSMNAEIVATLEKEYPAPRDSYRDILSKMLDFLLEEGLVPRTEAEKNELLAEIYALPEGVGEDVAKRLFVEVLDDLSEKLADYRGRDASQPSSDKTK